MAHPQMNTQNSNTTPQNYDVKIFNAKMIDKIKSMTLPEFETIISFIGVQKKPISGTRKTYCLFGTSSTSVEYFTYLKQDRNRNKIT